MLDESLVREILDVALSSGGSFAEVYAEERVSTSVRLDDRRVEELSTGTDRGAAVRVIAGETTGYAYSNRVEPEALRRAAEAAAAAVRGSERGRVIDLRRMEPPVRHPVANPAVEVPTERKVDWVREADDAARSHAPEVRQVVAGYGDSVQRLLIATSDGRWVEEERNRVRLIVNVVAARDGVMQTGFEGPAGLAGVELLEQHPPSEIARKAARQAIAMLDGRPAPAGELSLIHI